MRYIVSRLLTAAAVIVGVLRSQPAAGAAITPSLSLDQSAGKPPAPRRTSAST